MEPLLEELADEEDELDLEGLLRLWAFLACLDFLSFFLSFFGLPSSPCLTYGSTRMWSVLGEPPLPGPELPLACQDHEEAAPESLPPWCQLLPPLPLPQPI